MNKKSDYRHDPLYRVIDVNDEMRQIEGNFKKLFDRLKGINNLGIIPEVLEMAKYSKYEHHMGTIYQVNRLLNCAEESSIPDKYRKPLLLSAVFLHLGHFPFHYSTERALLLACGLYLKNMDNKVKEYFNKRIEKGLNQLGLKNEEKEKHINRLYSLENYRILYKYLSANIFLDSWSSIKSRLNLKDEDKITIIKNMIDIKTDGFQFLELADKADFVQRDALYLGTVRLDISPEHLYREGLFRQSSYYSSINEIELIENNFNYLKDRFYDSDRIRWFSRLYEKIVGSLILSENFNFKWLEELDDSQFKRLITENTISTNKLTTESANLPSIWTERALKLFREKIVFSPVFRLSNTYFSNINNIIDIEYKLIQKRKSLRGLLNYPFNKFVLIDIDYSDERIIPFIPKYKQTTIIIFQDNLNKRFIEILKIIRQLVKHCSIIDIGDKVISDIRSIREGLCRQFSWTGSIRIDNKNIIEAISDAIKDIEDRKAYKKGEFIKKFLESLSSIKTYDELWHNIINQMFWLSRIEFVVKENKEYIEHYGILNDFVEGMLSLPVKLLQYKGVRKYLEDIYQNLLIMIPESKNNDKKGNVFEALWLINRILENRGDFQFYINGMVVVDLNKPKNQKDINEYDVIEFLINEDGKSECYIYACSIADDFKNKNISQLNKLATYIHNVYKDLDIYTRFVVPKDKSQEIWEPKEEQTGLLWERDSDF